MATPRLLSDNELATMKNVLSPLFSNADAFNRQLEATRRIASAVSAGGSSSGSTTENGQKLALIATLDDFANGDLDLIWFVYSQAGTLTMQDAGKKYNLTVNRPFLNLARYQMKLFDAQPTEVLWSLMSSDLITTSLDWSTKSKVLEVLNSAMSRSFKIGREPIDNMMNNSAYSSSLSTDAVKNFFRRLWRLSALVKLPHDLSYLWQSSYDSAQQIAHSPRTSFVTTVNALGMSEESAVAVHDHATMVDLRNEQVWTALLASKSQWSAAQVSSNTPGSSSASPPLSSQLINYANMFGDANFNVCADCSSVTGPSAYFVDLLRMLKNCPSDPILGNINSSNPSLLERLFARRPDLRTLHLSCANVNVLIPYVDLANEIMESFIQNLATAGSAANIPIQAYNMSNQDTTAQCLAQPKQTNYTVYRHQVGTRVFPLDVFPYNQAVDTQRCYLEALGSSKYEVMSIFNSKYRLQSDANQTGLGAYKRAEMVGKYALAAEYLDLQPEDFVAITTTSVFPLAYYTGTRESSLGQATYNSRIGLSGTAQYWGFATDAAMVSEADGLPDISKVLLPRAALSMQELLDLLKSRFVGGRLALGNVNDTPVFTTNIADLRLRHPSQTNSKGPLTVEDCAALHSFLRLWRKISWSMEELDVALSCLGDQAGSATSLPRITADTIAALAAVGELQTLTGISILRLMPLWSVIDTWGNSSLYARLFLQGRADKDDAVFGKDSAGFYLSNTSAKMSDNKGVLLAGLGVPDEHFNFLLWSAKISNDLLNLSNVSSLYRNTLLCQLLDISPVHYAGFTAMFDKGFSPFKTPQTTLSMVKGWQSCTSSGISLGQALFITGKDVALDIRNPGYGTSNQGSIELTVKILIGLSDIDSQVPVGDAISLNTTSTGEVARIANLMFDAATAAKVFEFVEGRSCGQNATRRTANAM